MISSNTVISREILEEIARHFNLEEKKVKLVKQMGGIANENYLIEAEGREYVLKVIRDNFSETNINKEVEYHKVLVRNNIPISTYLKSIKKDYTYVRNNLPCVLLNKVKGKTPKLDKYALVEIGEYLARIHKIHPKNLPDKTNWFSRETIDHNIKLIRDCGGAGTKERFQSLYSEIENVDFGELPQSIVHGDLFADNTLFEETRLVALIDWERVSISASVLDFCMTLAGFFLVDQNFSVKDRDCFYKAYTSIRKLEDIEKATYKQALSCAVFALASWRFLHYNFYYPNAEFKDHYIEALKVRKSSVLDSLF